MLALPPLIWRQTMWRQTIMCNRLHCAKECTFSLVGIVIKDVQTTEAMKDSF
jgi:hypothetical protein